MQMGMFMPARVERIMNYGTYTRDPTTVMHHLLGSQPALRQPSRFGHILF